MSKSAQMRSNAERNGIRLQDDFRIFLWGAIRELRYRIVQDGRFDCRSMLDPFEKL